MGGLSIWHWIIVGGVAFILFGGRFKISDVMGDVAKGIKAFKKGLAEDADEAKTEEPAKSLEHQPVASQARDIVHDLHHADKPVDAKKA